MSKIMIITVAQQCKLLRSSLDLLNKYMPVMKTILVPTDFSNNAETALHFAILLAKKLKAKLLLVHCYQLSAAISAAPHNLLADELNENKLKAERSMKALCLHIQHAGDVPYEYLIENGSVLEVLVQAIKEKAVDLVVMGTKGSGRFSSAIFGSTTSDLMAKANCPILALPEGVRFDKGIRKMTYATDYRQIDISAIQKLVEIARLFHAQINILHISGDEMDAEEEVKLMSDFMKKVNQVADYNNLSFQILHGNDVEEKLEQHMAAGSTDMMVMATHYRGLMDRLFGRSITKEVVLETTVPLLAFHYSKVPEIKIY
jgi:nucleotide-binding universal stress UspA family protein